jgi:hypothetical protein
VITQPANPVDPKISTLIGHHVEQAAASRSNKK